jgi:hypothetical protein
MGQGAESNIGYLVDMPAGRSLNDPPDIVYQVSGAGSVAEAPPISWSARDDLQAAAAAGLTDWLDYLNTDHHDVWTWMGMRTSAERQRMHVATTYL